MKAVLLDDLTQRKKEFACLLALNVRVQPEALKYADENGVKLYLGHSVFALADSFMKHVSECERERREIQRKHAIFPCILQVNYQPIH